MKTVRVVFWVVLAFFILSFTLMNIDTEVGVKVNPLSIAPDYLIRLPALVIAAFVLGLLPYFILHHTTRWSLNRKLKRTERELQNTKQQITATTAPASQAEADEEQHSA